MEGGTEVEEELELVLELPQIKRNHWACTGEERRKKRARESRRAPILSLCLIAVSEYTLMHTILLTVATKYYTSANRHIAKTGALFLAQEEAHRTTCTCRILQSVRK